MASKFNNAITTTLTLLFFAALLLVPMLVKHEPLRWQAASAMRQYDNGDQHAAIASLQKIADRLPNDGYIQTTLIQWLWNDGQADRAIEICNEQLTLNPNATDYLRLRRTSECKAGDFSAAWKTHQQLRQMGSQRVAKTVDELNEQAYFRALADENLPLAEAEIEAAIDKLGTGSDSPSFTIPLSSKGLIAAALLSRGTRSDSLPSIVLRQLAGQIGKAQSVLSGRENSLVSSLSGLADGGFPLDPSQASSLDDRRTDVEFARRDLAFLLTTRALLLDDEAQADRCDVDRAQVVQLGFQPQELLALLPDEFKSRMIAQQAMALLDTKGLVLTKLPWESDAENDSRRMAAMKNLNIAAAVSETLCQKLEESPEIPQDVRVRCRETFAEILFHRAMANDKAGDKEAADADRQRIRSLGIAAEENLY